jgi:predicted MPP superfamily phosphohydrolase
MNRRDFLKFAVNTAAGTAVAAIVGLEYSAFENQWYKIRRFNLTLPKLPPSFRDFSITHLSDLHINHWTTPERFSRVVEITNQLNSDTIVITGDIIDGHTPGEMFADVVYQLSKLSAELGVYAVLGNHDHWRDHQLVREFLKESKITDLSNRINTFSQGNENLYLCGLDDYWERKHDLASVTDPLPPDACAILLVHEPDYADLSATTQRFSLQLSGHSHGGQVDMPFYGPIVLPQYARKYPRGLYRVEDMLLYTNTGIGMTGPRVRFNCRPEIVVFTLS